MSELQTIETKSLIQTYFQALANRDLNTLLDFFAEEVDWCVPGNEELAPWLGERRNKTEIEEFYRLLWQSVEPINGQIERILAEGNFGVATGKFSARMLRSSQVYTSIFSVHFGFTDGKITYYRLLEDSQGLVEALSLPI